jgi:tRNA U34 5-methylaminomethyl-2-thiouridine-forming methyltransferase MnmC
MEKVITKDGSVTFHNAEVDETYHSVSGAKEESVKKFIEPLGDLVNPKILDVCFGLGYNSAAALDHFKACKITAIELDKNILDKIKELDAPFESYAEIKECVSKETEHVRLIIGDVLVEVDNLEDDYFDAVLFDPFSPSKSPELWNGEFFSKIASKVRKGGILTTYSCAGKVRRALKEAGFEVSDGPCVGRRAPSTVAVKK